MPSVGDAADIQIKRSWGEAARAYLQGRVVALFFLGFSAGLPYLLVFSTLTLWLRSFGVERTVIGFFAWVGITYSIKVLWAPVIDQTPLPLLDRLLGRRRSWMLLAQLGIAAGLLGMSFTDPTQAIGQVALFALLVAFSSATQDICIDAYRIEVADDDLQGAMASMYVAGYRLALLAAGAGALYLAEYWSWSVAYQGMALLVGVGVVTTLLVPTTEHAERPSHWHGDTLVLKLGSWFANAVAGPFLEFFRRNGRSTVGLLALVAVYKLSDVTMGIMANPFYLDLGFTITQIADVAKLFGFFMTIAGTFLGGLLVLRYGIAWPLLLGAVLVAVTNLAFAFLAVAEPSLTLLAVVVSADNLSGGVATSVFIAWLSSLTSRSYTATQYALFSSLMTLPAKLISGGSGWMVDTFSYFAFFTTAAALGIPAILLAIWAGHRIVRNIGNT